MNYLKLKSGPKIQLNVEEGKPNPNSTLTEKEYAVFEGLAGWDDHTVIHGKVRIDHIWKHDFDETMIVYFKLRMNPSTETKQNANRTKYLITHLRVIEWGTATMSLLYGELTKFSLRLILDELHLGFFNAWHG